MCGLCNFGCCNHKSFHVEITEQEQEKYRKKFGLDLELEWSQNGCCDLLSDDGSGCSLGDERVDFVTNYNWKAHHRETNNLMGLIWDFIDNKPRIVHISYSSNLSINDWGKTVVPKKNSRTTSVSIMNKDGISKMISGRICMLRKPSYRVKLERNIKKYI